MQKYKHIYCVNSWNKLAKHIARNYKYNMQKNVKDKRMGKIVCDKTYNTMKARLAIFLSTRVKRKNQKHY